MKVQLLPHCPDEDLPENIAWLISAIWARFPTPCGPSPYGPCTLGHPECRESVVLAAACTWSEFFRTTAPGVMARNHLWLRCTHHADCLQSDELAFACTLESATKLIEGRVTAWREEMAQWMLMRQSERIQALRVTIT